MANSTVRAVIGLYICPYCKYKNAIIWVAGHKDQKFTCLGCTKKFKIKRQKILYAKPITVKGEVSS